VRSANGKTRHASDADDLSVPGRLRLLSPIFLIQRVGAFERATRAIGRCAYIKRPKISGDERNIRWVVDLQRESAGRDDLSKLGSVAISNIQSPQSRTPAIYRLAVWRFRADSINIEMYDFIAKIRAK